MFPKNKVYNIKLCSNHRVNASRLAKSDMIHSTIGYRLAKPLSLPKHGPVCPFDKQAISVQTEALID